MQKRDRYSQGTCDRLLYTPEAIVFAVIFILIIGSGQGLLLHYPHALVIDNACAYIVDHNIYLYA